MPSTEYHADIGKLFLCEDKKIKNGWVNDFSLGRLKGAGTGIVKVGQTPNPMGHSEHCETGRLGLKGSREHQSLDSVGIQLHCFKGV